VRRHNPDGMPMSSVRLVVLRKRMTGGCQMKTRSAVSLGFLILLIGLWGCGSSSSLPCPSVGPCIQSISPNSVHEGSPDLRLVVLGSNFAAADADERYNSVIWTVGGTDTSLPLTLVSKTQLTTVVPQFLLVDSGTAHVRVEIRTIGAGSDDPPIGKSNSVGFDVEGH